MLAPRLEARLLQDLAVQKHEKVLEIGTGSGYMAALLGRRAAHVLTLEIEPELVSQARKNLATEGVSNVEVRQADGTHGAAADGPFDVIILSGSVAEVPQALLAQLQVGGRLAAIVGEEPMMRATFITRNSDAAWTTAEPWDTMAPRLVHFAEHSLFRF
jgi:protein-L-isoaspartate(D-aspartate) O-methyltransferase